MLRGVEFLQQLHSCNGPQTRSLELANKDDFELTLAANMRGCEPALAANEPTLGSCALLVKATRKALRSELLCRSAIFRAIAPITFLIQYISPRRHHQK